MKSLLIKKSKEDLAITGLLFAFFFLVIAVFQVLKPLKSGLFVEHYGAHMELYAKLANILIASIGVGAFTLLYNKLPRQRFIYTLSGFFLMSFLSLAFALGDEPDPFLIWTFYLLGDLEATMMVAAFWAYLTDLSHGPNANRLFGPIGAGGVLGGWAGVSAAKVLFSTIGTSGLLCLSAFFMGGVMLIVGSTETLLRRSQVFTPTIQREAQSKAAPFSRGSWWEAFEGARLVVRSRYLASIAGIMGLYEVASQLMDYQFKLAAESMSGVQATQAFMTDVYLYASLLAVITQFFLVGIVMKRFGLGATLLVLPAVIIAGSLGFLAMPSLVAVSLLVIFDNGLSYSIQQTGRESLYLATGPDEKYKGRAFISMFVQRTAKGVSILAVILLGTVGVATQYLSLLTIGMMGVMILLSINAGRHYALATNRNALVVPTQGDLDTVSPGLDRRPLAAAA
ncbi:MAG: hypothetical protein KF876_05290 [Nitrospira sp.]|nr:hypothetical protein [Nitrospira sp.]MBX3333516.1 hypothetical protein [Nitrospira sp.]